MSASTTTLHSFRTLLFCVLAALVFAQTLAALHRVVHAPTPNGAQAQRAAPQASILEALFAGHDVEHGCDHYDQLNHADLASGAAPGFAHALIAFEAPAGHPGWHLAPQAAGFLARGPPTSV